MTPERRAEIASPRGVIEAALLSMTRCWALELAAEGITANMVSPGAIETAE